MKGFKTALEKAGVSLRNEFIDYGDWEYDSGYRIAKKLLSLPHRPSAIFVMNDLMAAGCINYAQSAGLGIPQDLSVIGFDNREIARYLPVPLTTVQLPNKEIGHKSAKMVLDLLDGKEIEPNRLILPCQLVERASVASIN
jgi:LacI family transcriptional regulator